jgi:hypothetical protein
MEIIFWGIFAATILLALAGCPRKAAPIIIIPLFALLVAI